MPFFVAIALALVLTWAARWLGLTTGLVDRPLVVEPEGERPPGAELKIHTVPIPVLGGLGVVAAVLGALLVAGSDLPLLAVAGVVLATAIGLVDDVRPQPASVRMIALAVAAVPIAVGLPLDPLGLPARVGVVVLLLLMANAVNLIDGQDGLAGGLGAIGSVGLAAVIAANGNPVFALVVAGALVGFLAWNLPPARVFLGNGGAYGLGALLTVLAAQATIGHGWHGLLAAALCLGVFAFELTFTVVRRLLGSQRLATGDRRHSYDLLGRSRGNRDRSTLALWTLGAVSAGAGYASDQVSLAAAGSMLGVAFVIGTAAGGRLWRDAVTMAEPQQPTERP